jgi:hypothetical protein
MSGLYQRITFGRRKSEDLCGAAVPAIRRGFGVNECNGLFASVDQRPTTAAIVELPAMLRSLKFCGALLINLAVAVIGTVILDTEVRRLIPTHTVAAIVWKEIILSIVCAAFLGFFMWRTWRSSAAKWIWVLAAPWFVFGYLTIARSANVWGRLSGFSSGSVLSAPDVRTFFAFTIPLIRAISYSLGAYISSLLYHARAELPDGC